MGGKRLLKSGRYNGRKRPTMLYVGSEVYCPLCLGRTDDVHVHHVKWTEIFGRDGEYNKLAICSTCHHAIHSKDESDLRLLASSRAHYYMMALWGLRSDFGRDAMKRAWKERPELFTGIHDMASLLTMCRQVHLGLKAYGRKAYRASFENTELFLRMEREV